MRYLRTVSTRRLLTTIAASVAAISGFTAIAIAAGSGGPVPAPKPLAQAVHDALSAPSVQGFSARVTFTNHLIDSTNIVGIDPIINGATGRLWIADDHRIRLELQNSDNFGNGDAQAVIANGRFWVFDPAMNTVYAGQLPKSSASRPAKHPDAVPTVADIEKQIGQVLQSANLNASGRQPVGAVPGDVGGRPTYSVSVSPKHDGGLLGSVELAWDAEHGVPLDLAIRASGEPNPVLELKADQVSYGAISSSVFDITPPSGAKVVQVSAPGAGATTSAARGHAAGEHAAGRHRGATEKPQTVAGVQSRLTFPLAAPDALVGLPRHTVQLVDFGKRRGALVTYGQNLGGILVLEQPAGPGRSGIGSLTSGRGEHRTGLSLPTISIGGVTGQELDTALGTMVTFTRGGVSYTVLGSVPPAAADAAARAL